MVVWYVMQGPETGVKAGTEWVGDVARMYSPTMKVARRKPHQRGTVKVVVPQFPGYVFSRNLTSKQMSVLRNRWLISPLRLSDREGAATVDDGVLDECRGREGLVLGPCAVEHDYKPGDQVSITSGALEGYHGVVLETIWSTVRVQIESFVLSVLVDVDTLKKG